MLGFLFSMESLALSLGCDRTQLELAVAQSHPEDPPKVALLWAARTQLGLLTRDELRARCDELLGNPLAVPAYPRYLSGFVHALEPVPALTDFVVEQVSNAFARLPDPVLLPWLPTLISALRAGSNTGARKIFLGWMSNWQYAGQVPTEKWRNAMTIPKELALKQVNGKILLTSNPVKELAGIERSPVA